MSLNEFETNNVEQTYKKKKKSQLTLAVQATREEARLNTSNIFSSCQQFWKTDAEPNLGNSGNHLKHDLSFVCFLNKHDSAKTMIYL